jgi:hypothetical protein
MLFPDAASFFIRVPQAIEHAVEHRQLGITGEETLPDDCAARVTS